MHLPHFEPSPVAQETIADGPVRHAYVHIPYCIAKCRYCAFVSEAVGDRGFPYQPFVDALLRQIIMEAPEDRSSPLSTVYLGGGTPTCLPTQDLAKILETIREYYGLADDAEVTIEMNPGTLEHQALDALRRAGFNRLSIGVQSMQDDLLRRLGRVHTAKEVVETIRAAQHAGFSNINADVMLALEGQTLEDVMASIDCLMALEIPHLSFYSLIVEEGTPLERDVRSGKVQLPREEEERMMYRAAFDHLEAQGYRPYEISNSARVGAESRHNLAYWGGHSYYAWGPAASGYVMRTRYTMEPRTEAYIQGFGGEDADAMRALYLVEDVIDADEQIREYIIFGLRRSAGISDREALESFGRPLPQAVKERLDDFAKEGLLQKPGPNHWAYTRLGLDLADRVARAFI